MAINGVLQQVGDALVDIRYVLVKRLTPEDFSIANQLLDNWIEQMRHDGRTS